MSEVIKKILFLSANPRQTKQLRLDEEFREIKEGLRRAKEREQFILESAEAVRYRDLRRAVLDNTPNIVHFSGHGAGEDGLVFEDELGQVKLVDARSLAGLFQLFADTVKCVVLNACYSQVQAEAITQHIPYVVGMGKAIGDRAAIEFAIAFYDALGSGREYKFAFDYACNAIDLAGIPESDTPKLLKGTASTPPDPPPNPREAELNRAFRIVSDSTPPDPPPNPREAELNRAFRIVSETNDLLRIRGSWGSGKTTFLRSMYEKFKDLDNHLLIEIKFIDEAVDEDFISMDKLAKWFCKTIDNKLKQLEEERIRTEYLNLIGNHFEDYYLHPKSLETPNLKIKSYFQNYVLKLNISYLVIVFDDFECVYKRMVDRDTSPAHEFCEFLRAWCEDLSGNGNLNKLHLVIVNSTERYIQNGIYVSPLGNIGSVINLTELTENQIKDMVNRYGLNLSASNIQNLYDLIGGNITLVDKAIKGLRFNNIEFNNLMRNSVTLEGIYKERFIELSRTFDNQDNLKSAWRRVVLSSTPVPVAPRELFALESMGLIRLERNNAYPSCRLYRDYFSELYQEER